MKITLDQNIMKKKLYAKVWYFNQLFLVITICFIACFGMGAPKKNLFSERKFLETMAIDTVNSNSSFRSFPVSTQTGKFTAEFDVVPNDADMDGIVGILNGTAAAFTDMACIVQFYKNRIEAINATIYKADINLNYTPGTRYHFRLVIDIPNHLYDIYVTPEGCNEIVLGASYGFRASQANVSQLTGWAIWASPGTHTVSNMIFKEL